MPPYSRKAIAAYVIRLLRPHGVRLALTACCIVIGSTLFLTPPMMTKYILEQALPRNDMGLLAVVCLLIVVIPIVGSALILLETALTRFVLRLSGRVRSDLYDGLQHRPLDWLQQRKPGELIVKALDHTSRITDFVDGKVWWMLWLAVTIVSGFSAMAALHAGLAAVLFVLWSAHAVVLSFLGRRIKRRTAETARQLSRVTDSVRDLVSAAPFLKASGLEAKSLESLRGELRQEWKLARRSALTDHMAEGVSLSLSALFLAALYAGGGWLAARGEMTVGSLAAFVAVYNWVRPFGIMLIENGLEAIRVKTFARNVAEVAFPVERNAGSVPHGRSPFGITAERIGFRYGDKPVLREVELHIEPGSVVSIVGPRGSGKSTLTELLLGLRKPTSGGIAIGGVPLSRLDEDWLRSHVLCVTQEISLRNGTIEDNIVYGGGPFDPERIREAVRMAGLEDWVDGLPDGLRTRVGERGLIVSGGERQRIGIARALLRRPAVLLLDEATSALDRSTERNILDRLLNELKGSTLLFVTHRLEIAERSDRVFVMKDGHIVEAGSFAELLARGGELGRLAGQAEEAG